MKPRSSIYLWGGLLAIPLSLILISNTFFGPQNRTEQALELMAQAEVSLENGRVDEAIERLRLAVQLAPDFIEANRSYQNVMRKGGRAESLQKEYQERLQSNPESAEAHYLYGRLLKGEDFERELNRAIDINKRLWWAHSGLGHYLFDNQEYQKSIPYLHTAYVELGQKEALLREGLARMHLKEMEKAIQVWDHYKTRNPLDPEGWFQEGRVYLIVGKPDQAFPSFEVALQLHDDDLRIYTKLIECCMAQGKMKEGIQWMIQARDRIRSGDYDKTTVSTLDELSVHVMTVDPYHVWMRLHPRDSIELFEIKGADSADARAVLLQKENGPFEFKVKDQVREYLDKPSFEILLQEMESILRS